MGSGGAGPEGAWQRGSSVLRGGEAPRVPWPPKKWEQPDEIRGGVYPHEGFPTQRFKWGRDMKDARSQLAVGAAEPCLPQLSPPGRASPFRRALLGSATVEGRADKAQSQAVVVSTQG